MENILKIHIKWTKQSKTIKAMSYKHQIPTKQNLTLPYEKVFIMKALTHKPLLI